MQRMILVAILLPGLALAAPAEAPESLGLSAGFKVGVDFSQPFNELGVSPALELELGWRLPLLNRSVEIFLAGQWVGPEKEGKLKADERFSAPGEVHYILTQDTLRLTLGVLYRLKLDAPIRPFAAIGFRSWMTSTTMEGDVGGEKLGSYTEEGTGFGASGSLGAEWHFGPNAALFELQGGWAPYDQVILSDTQLGTFALNLGWRHFF